MFINKENCMKNVSDRLRFHVFEQEKKVLSIVRDYPEEGQARNIFYSYLHGKANIPLHNARFLAEHLGISIDTLALPFTQPDKMYDIKITLYMTAPFRVDDITRICNMVTTPLFDTIYEGVMGAPRRNPNKIDVSTASIGVTSGESDIVEITIRSIGIPKKQMDVLDSTREVINFISRLCRPYARKISYKTYL